MRILDELIDWLLSRPRLRDLIAFRQAEKQLNDEELLRLFNRLKERYKEGIADTLGIPVDQVNDEAAARWALNYLRRFLSREAYMRLRQLLIQQQQKQSQ